jgi:hypothetical protein
MEFSRRAWTVPTGHRIFVGFAIALAILAVVIFVPKLGFVRPDGELTDAERAAAESDFRGHFIQLLGGLVLAAGAYFAGRTFALNREGQITERFTRAVEQLASDKLDIRLGGIFALERIAYDSKTHHEPVMEVLTTFLREHARWEPDPVATRASPGSRRKTSPVENQPALNPLRADFQAVVTVVGRRDLRHSPNYSPDFSDVDMRMANLYGANLTRASFIDSHLEGAWLANARLQFADLSRAHLRWAYMGGAKFDGAILLGADLRDTRRLSESQLSQSWIDDATKLPDHLADAAEHLGRRGNPFASLILPGGAIRE